jgi:hypothetical protein
VPAFLCISIYLFFSTFRYTKNDLLILLLFCLLTMLYVTRNTAGLSGLTTIGNYLLTIFFAWGLYRHIARRKWVAFNLLELYSYFFYFVTICSIFSIFFFLIFGELDLIGLKSDIYQHLVTPFGVLFRKEFGPFTVYRACFYFVEPVHIAVYYAANIVIVAPLLKERQALFAKANLVGGVLTFSMTFFIVLVVLYGWVKSKSILSFLSVLLMSGFLALLVQIADVASYSSGLDRFQRFYNFYIAMDSANLGQLLFGYGVAHNAGFQQAFNSGLTLSIYQAGLIGMIIEFAILYRLSSFGVHSIFVLMSALVVDPLRMPFFWFFTVVLAVAAKEQVRLSGSRPLVKRHLDIW